MGKQLRDLRKNKFQVEVVDVAATKRARRKYAKEQREASRGKVAGRSRGRGRGKGRGRGRGVPLPPDQWNHLLHLRRWFLP